MSLVEEYFKYHDTYTHKYGPKTVIFMQVGSFYEIYGVDNKEERFGCVAEIADLLNIQLTRKNKKILENSRKNPLMCGIPCHSFLKYRDVLRQEKYTIVMIDQMTPPPKVTRSVVEIISPSTYIEDDIIDLNSTELSSNNLMSIYIVNETVTKNRGTPSPRKTKLDVLLTIGISVIDLSTGRSISHEIYGVLNDKTKPMEDLYRLLIIYRPSEIIFNFRDKDIELIKYIENYLELSKYTCHINNIPQDALTEINKVAYKSLFLSKIFKDAGQLSPLEYLNMEMREVASTSYVLMLKFAYEHNENIIDKIDKPNVKWEDEDKHMILAYNAIDQLNIISGVSSDILLNSRVDKGKSKFEHQHSTKTKFKSLFAVVNHTSTMMGKRLLTERILNPSLNIKKIQLRYDIIEEMMKEGITTNTKKNTSIKLYPSQLEYTSQGLFKSKQVITLKIYEELEKYLVTISDLERNHRKISLGYITPMEFVKMSESYQIVIQMIDYISRLDGNNTKNLQMILPDHSTLTSFFEFIEDYNKFFDLDEMAKCVITLKRTAANARKYDTQGISSFFKEGYNKEIDQIREEISMNNEFLTSVADILSTLVEIKHKVKKNIREDGDSRTTEIRAVKILSNERDGIHLICTNNRTNTIKALQKQFKKLKKAFETHELDDFNFLKRKLKGEVSQDIKYSDESYELLRTIINNYGDLYLQLKQIILSLEFSSLSNNTKITSPDINQISEDLQKQQEQIKVLTIEHYIKCLNRFYEKYNNAMKNIAKFVGEIDFLKSLTKAALLYNYCKPIIRPWKNKTKEDELSQNNNDDCSFIIAKDLRHPLIERLTDTEYITNNITIGRDINGILLFGCNSAGKSSLMKAIPSNQILAQMGSYTAASYYEYSPFTSIITRISGEDNLFQGRSGFIVEMQEVRSILKRSDIHTLSVGDEICKGTETSSANSIVAAVIHTLAKKRSNFLFATHLHSIPEMAMIKQLKNVKSFHLDVTYDPNLDCLIYNRKLVDGPGNAMYGLEVAKALDLGTDFIELAYNIRSEFLSKNNDTYKNTILPTRKSHFNSSVFLDECVVCGKTDPASLAKHHLREQNEANSYGMIEHFHKNSSFNLVTICKDCHTTHHNEGTDIGKYVQTTKGIKLLSMQNTDKNDTQLKKNYEHTLKIHKDKLQNDINLITDKTKKDILIRRLNDIKSSKDTTTGHKDIDKFITDIFQDNKKPKFLDFFKDIYDNEENKFQDEDIARFSAAYDFFKIKLETTMKKYNIEDIIIMISKKARNII